MPAAPGAPGRPVSILAFPPIHYCIGPSGPRRHRPKQIASENAQRCGPGARATADQRPRPDHSADHGSTRRRPRYLRTLGERLRTHVAEGMPCRVLALREPLSNPRLPSMRAGAGLVGLPPTLQNHLLMPCPSSCPGGSPACSGRHRRVPPPPRTLGASARRSAHRCRSPWQARARRKDP
jgi:hypothetical protein